jgi:hypothetical protein
VLAGYGTQVIRSNMREVAQAINPAAHVVYVDDDRCNLGCAHARTGLLAERYEAASGSGPQYQREHCQATHRRDPMTLRCRPEQPSWSS